MRRMHYAWVILLLCFVAIAAGVGVRLAFGTFVHPWEHEFGVGRSVTSLIATASFVCYGLAQPVLGRWADRGGPHRALAASLAIVALGLVTAAFSRSIWLVAVAYALIASPGFAGLSQVTGSVAITSWFHDRRGLAMAIITLASAVGQMTIPPASLYLNDSLGWRQTLLLDAVAVAGLAPVILWLLKPTPAAMGTLPYGAAEPAAAARPAEGPKPSATLREVLAQPNFWWLAIPYFVCGVTTTGLIDTHLVPFAEDHHLPQAATALAVMLLAGFNSLGVMLSGYLSDRVPRRYLLAFLYGVRALTLLFLITVRDPQQLIAFSVIYGLVDFSTVPPTISLSAELMGSANVGLVYGLVSLSHQVGSAVGAFVPGLLFDRTGSYHSSLVMASAALLVATTLSLWLRERRGVPVGAVAD
jgi:sugar phosphate permease